MIPLDSNGDYRMSTEVGKRYKGGSTTNYPTVKVEGNKLTFTGLSGNLSPNYCVVIEFVTTATKEREGVVTNNGEATFKNDNIKITNESIVAGERKDDKTIFNSANYNIVGLTTESWKTITYTNQGHTGDPHTDPATDTG